MHSALAVSACLSPSLLPRITVMALAAATAGGVSTVSRLLWRDAAPIALSGLASRLLLTSKAGAGYRRPSAPSVSSSPTSPASSTTHGTNVTPTICSLSTQINRNPSIVVAAEPSSSRLYTTSSDLSPHPYTSTIPSHLYTHSDTPHISLFHRSKPLKSLHQVKSFLPLYAHATRHTTYTQQRIIHSAHRLPLCNISTTPKHITSSDMSAQNNEAETAQGGILESVTNALKAVGIVSESKAEPAKTSESKSSNGGTSTPQIRTDDKFVGSVDQGTTSSRFIIFNDQGMPVASHQIELENIYPQSGYVTQRFRCKVHD